MVFKKKKREPSDNYCVLCGRNTNDKRFPTEEWINYFFSCNKCEKVWCATCMGQLSKLGPKKTFKFGKKGGINCPECENQVFLSKLPNNLIFKQKMTEQVSQNTIQTSTPLYYCKYCGESLSEEAEFCHICGAKQNTE
ncbi:MAG: hypothetical protein JXA99_15415 [Candidatus Lokiarchaeota archaeon]|nr:hypothetical protein [Candidatus Lokiarchaeota archaeon]